MIGEQETGAINGIVVTTVSHEGLRVFVQGKQARLAIIMDDGSVIASGDDVAREVEAVVVNGYREFLKGTGHLRVKSDRLSVNTEPAVVT